MTMRIMLLSGLTTLAIAQDWSISITTENDLYWFETDRNYTAGNMAMVTQNTGVPDWAERFANTLSIGAGQTTSHTRITYSVGQALFTPEDITNPELQPFDRPYSAWLYVGIGLQHRRPTTWSENVEVMDWFEFQGGVVGPSALGEQTQTIVHEIVGAPIPQGWQHQLPDVFGFNFIGQRTYSYNPGLDWLRLRPHVGLTLGNVWTNGRLGGSIVIGNEPDIDWGTTRLDPAIKGAGLTAIPQSWFWSASIGADFRYVARNITLDGTYRKESHSVNRYKGVMDLQAGVRLGYQNVVGSFTWVFRSSEFEYQDVGDGFGSINLEITF